MSPFGKRKEDRDAEEKARRQARREELSARLRGELLDAGEEDAGEPVGKDDEAAPKAKPAAEAPKREAKTGKEPEARARPKPKPKVEPQPEVKPERKTRPVAKAKPERKTKPAPKAKAKAKPPEAGSDKRRSFLRRGRGAEETPAGKPRPGRAKSEGRGPKAASDPGESASDRAKARAERKRVEAERSKSAAKGPKAGSSRPKTGTPARARGAKPAAKKGAGKRTPAGRRETIAKGVGSARAASARGLKASAARAKGAAPAGKKALSTTGKVLTPVLVFFLRVANAIQRALTIGLRGGRRAIAWTVATLDRLLTPARVVVGLTVACAACMIVAQYVDYRGVQIGQPQYADVAYIAPPPQVEIHQAADNHSLVIFGLQVSVIVPIAIVAALLGVLAIAGNRRKLGRLISLAGVAGVLITLLVDMPRGLDEGDAGIAFAGAHAKLANGFYAELAASAGLILCGLLLSLHLRPSAARSRGKRRGPSPAKPGPSSKPSAAKKPEASKKPGAPKRPKAAKPRTRPSPSLAKGASKGDSPLAEGGSS